MSVSIGANGNSYSYPQTDDTLWGDDATNWASAVSAALSALGLGATVNSKAVVDMISTTKGALLPRMTTTQRDAIATPPTGLLIYNTTTNEFNVYTGSAWFGVPVRDTLTTNRIIQWDGSKLVDSSLTASGSDLTIAGNFTAQIITANTRFVGSDITAASSAGILFNANGGTDVALFGAGGGSGATFYGGVNVDGILGAGDGTVSAPGIHFASDADNGLYRIGANQVGIAIGGAKVGELNSNGIQALDNFLHIQDQKSSGTGAGTFTSGAWRTRDLNTTLTNRITSASLSSNAVTLPAGTYYIEATATVYKGAGDKLRIYQTSGTPATLLNGMSNYIAPGSDNAPSCSVISGEFTLASSQTIELQHQLVTTSLFGIPCSFGVNEVYADLKIWRKA